MSVETIFATAAQKPISERRAYLDEACGTDAELRRKVERLLVAHDAAEDFLEVPAAPDRTGVYSEIAETVGTKIGPYVLRERIGEGGFGLVFVAEQTEPVKRKVALKIIKPGMDTRQVVARFEAERQALALMDHPNIARVLDAGTTQCEPGCVSTGRPYFVMELVRGIPITEYCDKNQLSPRERLELFITVCQAIQHAHQKGIIHRDVKPSNVLVTCHDGKPVAKVIDFGVAKAIHQSLSARTIYTNFAQMIGTPLYMSPEQAEMSGQDIDTRSDIYSLGVLLYELLTGSTPIDKKRFAKAAYDEIRRMIREDEPQKPSTRLSTSDSIASVAAQRHTEPTKLPKLIRGDLDWITMKALEKDRTRRYETANGLARDIQRYLNDEPVEACPPSAAYRLRKFAKKNRAALIAAGLVTLALVAGIAVSTWQALLARKAEHIAQLATGAESQQRLRAEGNERKALEFAAAEKAAKESAETNALIALAVRDFLFGKLLSQADSRVQADTLLQFGRAASEVERDPRISVLLDRAAAEVTVDKIETHFPGQPELQAEILQTIGNTYRGIGKNSSAITHLERARNILRAKFGARNPMTLTASYNLAVAYVTAGKLQEGIALLEQVRSGLAITIGPDHPKTLDAVHELSWAYYQAGRLTDALRLCEESRKKMLELHGPDHPSTLATLNKLAAIYLESGQIDEAIRLYEQVRDAQTEQLGAVHPSTLVTRGNLAGAYDLAGKWTEAIRILEEVRDAATAKFGADHPLPLGIRSNLGYVYNNAGRYPEAIQILEPVRDGQLAKFGIEHTDTLATLNNLGIAYQHSGRLPEAIQIFEKVRDVRLAKFGADHPTTLIAIKNLARAYESVNRLDEALQMFEQVRDGELAKLGPNHRNTLITLNHLGRIYRTMGKLPESIRTLEQVRDAQTARLGAEHPDTLITLHNLALAYKDFGRDSDAIRILEPLRDLKLAKYGIDHADTQAAIMVLAGAYVATGKGDEAIPTIEQVCKLRLEQLGPEHPRTLSALYQLGKAYRDVGRLPDAIRILSSTHKTMSAKLGADAPETMATLNALAVAYRMSGRLPEALPLFEESAQGMEKRGFQHVVANQVLPDTIQGYEQAKDFPRAEVWRRKWLAYVKQRSGADSPAYHTELFGLGTNLLEQSKFAEAGPLLTAGYSGVKKQSSEACRALRTTKLTDAVKRLVQLYDAGGKPEEATKWKKELVAIEASASKPVRP